MPLTFTIATSCAVSNRSRAGEWTWVGRQDKESMGAKQRSVSINRKDINMLTERIDRSNQTSFRGQVATLQATTPTNEADVFCFSETDGQPAFPSAPLQTGCIYAYFAWSPTFVVTLIRYHQLI